MIVNDLKLALFKYVQNIFLLSEKHRFDVKYHLRKHVTLGAHIIFVTYKSKAVVAHVIETDFSF